MLRSESIGRMRTKSAIDDDELSAAWHLAAIEKKGTAANAPICLSNCPGIA